MWIICIHHMSLVSTLLLFVTKVQHLKKRYINAKLVSDTFNMSWVLLIEQQASSQH